MRSGLRWLVTTLLVFSTEARPDHVYLQNGSHIVGTITGVNDGKLVVDTEFAGEVSIALDAIQGIDTESENGFKLDSGEVLSGRLRFEDGRQELVRGDTRIEVTPVDIVAIGDPAELSDPKPEINWSGRAEFGLTLEIGNTERVNVNGRVRTTKETEVDRLILYFRGEYAEENDNKTSNEALIGTTYEYDVGERVFVFGQSELEFDEFENLDLRVTVSGGVGFFFLDNDTQTLKGRVGVAYQHQDFDDGTTTDDILALLGYEYILNVRDWFVFDSMLDFFANATETDDWRFKAENAFEVPISSTEAWKLRFGVRNEYDNEPQPGIKSLDTTVYSALVYDWK